MSTFYPDSIRFGGNKYVLTDAVSRAAVVELVNDGEKNLAPVNNGSNSSGSWLDIPLVLEPGNYVLYIVELTSTDTDANTCQVGLFDSSWGNVLPSYPQLSRGEGVIQELTVGSKSATLRIYCSDSSAHGSGDTVTITNLMVCTKAAWDASHDYISYKMPSNATTLLSTGDTTDRSNDILAVLNKFGECHLGAGTFCVSGFEMPAGSKLTGCGRKSVIKLLDSVTDGYCVRIRQHNTIEGIMLSGGDSAPTDINTDGATPGTRNGLYLAANADGSGSTQGIGLLNLVSNCFFENFDGSGFKTENTGGGLFSGIIMTDCTFRKCMVGINIAYYAEYSKYTNCVMYECNVACINNGGNNVFEGCTFHGVKGLVFDNTDGTKRNNAHGTCSACTFNHIDNTNQSSTLGGGKAVYAKNAANGFIFDGCQFWYGEIDIQSSRGFTFTDCLMGGNGTNSPKITVAGDYGAFFQGCIFHSTPVISVNEGTKFDNCYSDSDGTIVGSGPIQTYLASLIDVAGKNKFQLNNGSNTLPTRWIDIPCVLEAGRWTVSFESLVSDDTDGTVCQATFYDGTTARALWFNFTRGSNVKHTFDVLGQTTIFRIYASDSYAHSEGDTITITNAMCCKETEYNVSPTYIPYSSET